jgi:hypothetical protein
VSKAPTEVAYFSFQTLLIHRHGDRNSNFAPMFSTVTVLVVEGLWFLASRVVIPVSEKLGVTFLSKPIEKRLVKIKRIIDYGGRERLRHLTELAAAIEKMPFIYKGLDFDIVTGFVDVDYSYIDLKTFKPKQTIISADISIEKKLKVQLAEALKLSNKVLFLGNAGVGKTTFQRHKLLTSIRTNKFEYWMDSTQCVPFFVKLKFVNNDIEFPILNYLLTQHAYLAVEGKRTLTRLAEEGKLFLFLDGFDEVPFSREPGRNFCKEELEYMIYDDASSRSRLSKTRPEIAPFYTALGKSRTSRIWLSCRTAFYQQHALSRPSIYPLEPCALELRGIGKHRGELVKRIFDRHRSNEFTAKLLNEQFFLDQLDSDQASEIHKLSYTPLFLTVMCYNYAQNVIEQGTHKVRVADNVDSLIRECIKLLLIDVDAQKARNLSDAEREIQQKTRNDFLEEKKKFLSFFAAQLFVDNKALFDVTYITNKVRDFFKVFPNLPNEKEIIRGLDGQTYSPTIVDQLINCGIFVLSEVQKGVAQYDFPHQRFKEFLASEFFADDNSDFLMEHIKEKRLGELITVFFKISDKREMVLKRLLELTLADASNIDYYQSILTECLKQAPKGYDATTILDSFLSRALIENRRFDFTADVERVFRKSDRLVETVRQAFSDAWSQNKTATLSLCCQVLGSYNKPLLKQLLTDAFDLKDESKDESLIPRRVRLLSNYDPDLLASLVTRLFQVISPEKTERLEIYSQALNEYQPALLGRTLKQVFARSVADADWNSLVLCCEILKKNQQTTLDLIFEEHFRMLRRNNRHVRLPKAFLSYWRLGTTLSLMGLEDELDVAIREEKLFTACLCAELLLHIDEGRLLRALSRHMRYVFDPNERTFAQMLIVSPDIRKFLRGSEDQTETMRQLDFFLELYPLLRESNTGGLQLNHAEARRGDCYVISDRALDDINIHLQSKRDELDSESWNWLIDNRYKVFFSPEYISSLPGKVSSKLTKAITEATSLRYAEYEAIMLAAENLENIADGPIVFFTHLGNPPNQ